ncbi:flagellar biosynthesis protein FliO [Hypnocyclicus thermotrophus]|uniref:Flagellar biosynthesis protein FliO n=1 Tax=Hypnocyclicus thermotrophus TaxID=1627895 RepID=A0AA46I542_9FUSO|nr:flagellar biosynthetic protein FliO [Hypnocyclicus thermotrophus]TDT68558.1 flagellar biosynthesis protein FliO [Hypnocyclicus thermotrophus]
MGNTYFLNLILFLILMLLVIISYTLKKNGIKLNKKSNVINEITRYYFNAKCYISLIEINKKYILVGISENSIVKIDEFDELFLKDEFEKKEFTSFLDSYKNKNSNIEINNFKEKLKKMREAENEKKN